MAREGGRSSLNEQERKFCEMYADTQDADRALTYAGIYVPIERDPRIMAQDLMNRPQVRDYIFMLSDGGSNDVEGCVKRLEAIRREAWRRGDVRTVKDVEMEIAQLRGWRIERSEVKSLNMNVNGGVGSMDTNALLAILSSAQGQEALKQSGLMIKDNEVQQIEGTCERVGNE